MALGQYIAGMGFSNVGLGIVHSMAHSLGAFFDTPHGLANSILLPHVMRFNGQVCPDLFRNMGRAFGLNMEGLNDYEVIETTDAVKGNTTNNAMKDAMLMAGFEPVDPSEVIWHYTLSMDCPAIKTALDQFRDALRR